MSENKSNNPCVVVKKIVRANREKVFEAWTNPAVMQKWFFPGSWRAKTSNDLRVGGKYSIEMISDGRSETCDTAGRPSVYLHTGEYIEIVPPERLVFTWSSPSVTNTRVTVELRDLGDSTEVSVSHELLPTEEIRKQHSQGWEGCLANLSVFFEE